MGKAAIYKPGGELSSGTDHAGALTLDFPASLTVRKTFLLIESLSVQYFAVAS